MFCIPEQPRATAIKIIDQARLEQIKRNHPPAATSIDTWALNVRAAAWKHLMEAKQTYATADYDSGSGWTFFNIRGNKYRLATVINYVVQTVTIVDLYTHEQYDKL